MDEPQIAGCRPSRPIPLAVIAGTNDRIVPYDGWLAPESRLTSVPETLEFWRKLHVNRAGEEHWEVGALAGATQRHRLQIH